MSLDLIVSFTFFVVVNLDNKFCFENMKLSETMGLEFPIQVWLIFSSKFVTFWEGGGGQDEK